MIIPVGYAQANYRFEGNGLPYGAVITHGFNIELAEFDDPAAMAEGLFDAWIAATMPGVYSELLSVVEVEVKWGPNDVGPSGTDTGSAPGLQTSPPDSPNVSTLVRKNTGMGGRAGRGRLYIPGTPQEFVTADGALTSTFVTGTSANLEAWRLENIAIGCVPVLLHGAGSPIAAPLPITSYTVDTRVATQRRRLRR